jgi:HSP20 family protein
MKLAKHVKAKSAARTPASRVLTPPWPMRRLQHEINRLFPDPYGTWSALNEPVSEAWLPAVDIYEGKHGFLVKAEIPGMRKNEFEVYMSGDNLVIAGERKPEAEEKYSGMCRAERFFGHFHRSLPLSSAVDANGINARYRDGILIVTCPKTEEAKPRPIAVKVD